MRPTWLPVPLSRSATALSALPVAFTEETVLGLPEAASVGHLPFWTQDPFEETGLLHEKTLSPHGVRAGDGCSGQVCPVQGPLHSGTGAAIRPDLKEKAESFTGKT